MSRGTVRRIAANNNGKTVRSLAISSLKSSRLRNFFIVVTITLSTSLLMVMALFYSAMNTEKARQVAQMQHVFYYGLDRGQLEDLAEDQRTEYVLGMKRGQSVEIDGDMVQPVCYGSKPNKEVGGHISTVTPAKGKEPEKINEAMLSDAHCRTLGIKGVPGEKVSFTFLDGTTEEFVLSGIFHLEGKPKIFSVILSQKYGEKGTQLKDATYDGIVRIQNAVNMNQSTFLDTIRTIASDHGIERKNVNENNYFLDTLSGGARESQQNMLVMGVGIGILFVSVLVIYSVFYLAVAGRIRQFGQLRTIGMTKRQIQRLVCYEGLFLCAIGVPAGLLIGGAASYLIKPAGWDWKHTAVISTCVVVAEIVAVLLSIRKPAAIASSISPVEASKFSGVEIKKEKKGRFRKGHEKPAQNPDAASGSKKIYRKITPVRMAAMNRSRNKKKAALTMASLGIGGVLYMLAAFFITSTNLEEYSRQGSFQYGEFVIGLSYNVVEAAEHGEADIQADNPMDDALMKKIRSIPGVNHVRADQETQVHWEAKGDYGDDHMAAFSKEESKKIESLLEEGAIDYEAMVSNNSLLISYNDLIKELRGWNFQIGDTVKLFWYDGKEDREQEFTVAGILDTNAYIGYSNHYSNFILPEDKLSEIMNGMNLNSQMIVKTDRTKEAQIGKQLDEIMKVNPKLSLQALAEEEEENEHSFSILFSVMLGLSIFIVAFSILNMLNTLITNILTRKHEFAMLQSVGMTTKQLTKMIYAEGLMLTAGNLVITLVLGTAAGWTMVKIFESFDVNYMHFHFPWLFFLGYAVFTAIVPIIVSTVMIRGYQKEALVDRLR